METVENLIILLNELLEIRKQAAHVKLQLEPILYALIIFCFELKSMYSYTR